MLLSWRPFCIQALRLVASSLDIFASSMLLQVCDLWGAALQVHNRIFLLQVPDFWMQPTQQKRQPFGNHVQPLHAQTSARGLHWLPHRDLMRQPSSSRLSTSARDILLPLI